MDGNAQQVIEDPTPSRNVVLAGRIVSVVGVVAAAAVFGHLIGGAFGVVIGLIGAAAFADHTLRKTRRELADDRAEQRVLRVEWTDAVAGAGTRTAVQPAVVRRWVGPRPGSAAERSPWMVAGRDPQQLVHELRGRR